MFNTNVLFHNLAFGGPYLFSSEHRQMNTGYKGTSCPCQWACLQTAVTHPSGKADQRSTDSQNTEVSSTLKGQEDLSVCIAQQLVEFGPQRYIMGTVTLRKGIRTSGLIDWHEQILCVSVPGMVRCALHPLS